VAECAFNVGDCVITIGTGSFISINVGPKALCSYHGSYPLAGFVNKSEKIYILHSPVSSAGIAIDWARSIGLFDEYDEIESILRSTNTSNGVYFVPAFGLLERTGTDKSNVATGFIGLKQNTTKAEMLRSIFDSIAFSIKMRMNALLRDLKDHNIRLNSIRYVTEFLIIYFCFPLFKIYSSRP
jgi:glycerol kinase